MRPGGLTVDAPTGVINVIEGEAGSIARADVADFCIGAITEPDFPYIGKSPCISSVGGTSWVKDRSAAAREGMRAKMRAPGGLCDGEAHTRKLDEAYVAMWRRHCEESARSVKGGSG